MRNIQNKSTLSIIGHMAAGIAVMALIIWGAMLLWNLLLPSITGWSTINYWEMLGIIVLFRVMVGNIIPFKHRHAHKGGPQHLHDMAPEERRAFIKEQLSRLSKNDQADEQ